MTTIDTWGGSVCVDDRYYSDLDDAVEMIIDRAHPVTDPLQMPEFVECCTEQGPRLDAQCIIESMDDYEGNVHSDDNYASNSVDEHLKAELQELLDNWCKQVPWQCWMPNGQHVRVRGLIEARLAEIATAT